MSKILEIKDLNFSWGNNHVLRDINVNISPNELVAVLGVNGAGKSTLLKCINRILKSDSGSINLLEQDVNGLSLIDLSKKVSYVPQSVRTSFSMDVFDVVLLGRRPHISWRISEDDRDKVSSTLRSLGLEDFSFRKFDQLSGGERQRVIIAKAIAQDSSLLLMDEPTSDLDLKNQLETMKSLRKIISNKDAEKSALIAIHDINIAARFADRILLLHNGKIFASGTPREVLTKDNIAEVFSVDAEIIDNAVFWPGGSDSLRVIIKDEITSE